MEPKPRRETPPTPWACSSLQAQVPLLFRTLCLGTPLTAVPQTPAFLFDFELLHGWLYSSSQALPLCCLAKAYLILSFTTWLGDHLSWQCPPPTVLPHILFRVEGPSCLLQTAPLTWSNNGNLHALLPSWLLESLRAESVFCLPVPNLMPGLPKMLH